MDRSPFFQASIADELAHLMEKPLNTSITQGWTFTLEGEISSTAMREALDACLVLYPKLKCTLTKDYPSFKRLFRYCWEYREDSTSNTIFKEIEDFNPEHSTKDTMSYFRDYHSSHYVDITREPPIKVLLIRQSERSHLIFFVHHAAVDGMGFLIFFKSFIEFYEASIYGREKKSVATPDFRGIPKPHIPFRWKHLLPQYLTTYMKYGVHVNQEQLAYPGTQQAVSSMETLLAVARELSPQQFKTLRATAKRYQSTINDYLLASMFQTVKKWNQQRNQKPGRIYLDIPVSLRSPEDRTIGNIMCGFRIFLTPEVIGNKEETLRRVGEKRSFMMENNIAQKMVDIVWILKPLPLPLKNLLLNRHPDTYFPTLTMSNVGICKPNPSHQDEEGFHYLGEARICTMCFIGYAAPWPQLIALTYNNRMTISLSVFKSHFPLESAEAFLDSFIETINEQQ